MSSNLPDLLKCAVCGAQLVNPTTLKCGHTICTKHSACTLHPQPIPSDHRIDVSLNKIIALSSKHRQSTFVESDLLSHLRGESARQRATRPDEPLIPSEEDSSSVLEKDLLAECTCEICYTILFEPMTTPCQHVRLWSYSFDGRPLIISSSRPFAPGVCIALLITVLCAHFAEINYLVLLTFRIIPSTTSCCVFVSLCPSH